MGLHPPLSRGHNPVTAALFALVKHPSGGEKSNNPFTIRQVQIRCELMSHLDAQILRFAGGAFVPSGRASNQRA